MPEIIVKLGDNIVQKYFFFQEPLNIGRSADNEIVIENLAISRNHAQIRFEGGRYFVTDLDSSNGTYVNGVRVKKTEIMDKDVVSVGKHKIYFYDQKAPEPAVVSQPSMRDNDSTMLVDSKPEPELEAALVINKGRQKGQRFVLGPGITSLGRGSDNDIRLTDWFVSKQHAQVERRDKKFVIRDLGSWRHTFVNGEAVQEVPIRHGDLLQLGPTVELLVEIGAAQGGVGQRPAPRTPQELAEAPEPSGAAEAFIAAEASSGGFQQAPEEFEHTPAAIDLTPADSFDVASEELFHTSALPAEEEAYKTELPPHEEEQARDAFEEMANGATGVLPLDAIGLVNPLEEAIAEHDSTAEPQADEESSQPDWMNTGKLLAEAFSPPADEAAEQPAMFAEASEPAAESEPAAQAEAEAPIDTTGEPLVLAFADVRDDKADAVCEDLAEASLLAAASAAGSASAANGSAASGHASSTEKDRPEPAAKSARIKKKRGSADNGGAESPAAERSIPERSAQAAPQSPTKAPAKPSPAAATPKAPETAAAPAAASGDSNPEVAMWERALANPSQVIRKQAARRLKQLTGRDYDY